MALALAIVSELAARELGVRPDFVQIYAARVMLDGRLAEMATREGKTLAAALAAATAALARVPVHVITVNDYLASRDGENLALLYARLGLYQHRDAADGCRVAPCGVRLRHHLLHGERAGLRLSARFDRPRPARRHAAGTHRRIVAAAHGAARPLHGDHRRGRQRAPRRGARAVHPFAGGRAAGTSPRHYQGALALAERLIEGRDFSLDAGLRIATLTASERRALESSAPEGDLLWSLPRYREEAVSLALCAVHLFARDRDYLVRGGRVEIIDPNTGRTAPGRAWSRGLHQMIEEAAGPAPVLETTAEMTYQRFFPAISGFVA